jgi:hypothetical protein
MSKGIATGHGFNYPPVQSLSKVPFRLKFIFLIKKLFQEKTSESFPASFVQFTERENDVQRRASFLLPPPFQ